MRPARLVQATNRTDVAEFPLTLFAVPAVNPGSVWIGSLAKP
jgi:hypothetical protein